MSDLKQPVTPKGAVIFCVFLLFIFLIFKCACAEPDVYKEQTYPNKPPMKIVEYKDVDTIDNSTIEEPTPEELFEVYHYIYSKSTVIKAETNVLFVDGKNDELQITVDMPNGQTFVYNLTNKVGLGKINGLDGYLYKSQHNEDIQIFFHQGRKMIGFADSTSDFIFMNDPNYKE